MADRQLRSRRSTSSTGPSATRRPSSTASRAARLDNLFSNSVVALDADTGKLKWHYQFTPDDGHDWDSVQDMMLVDRVWRGAERKLLMHADRNGHFYVLDRTNGKFLSGTPFIYQNWNAGFDDERAAAAGSRHRTRAPKGSFLVYPTVGGATNFQAPSYSPLTGWFYLAFSEGGQRYASAPQQITRGQQYLGRGRAAGPPPARGPNQPAPNAGIKALDPETGKTVWSSPALPGLAHQRRARNRRQRRSSPHRATATSLRSTRRPGSISGTSRPAAIMRHRR